MAEGATVSIVGMIKGEGADMISTFKNLKALGHVAKKFRDHQ